MGGAIKQFGAPYTEEAEKARKTEEIVKSLDLDLSNPLQAKKGLYLKSQELLKAGNTQGAFQLLTIAQGISVPGPDNVDTKTFYKADGTVLTGRLNETKGTVTIGGQEVPVDQLDQYGISMVKPDNDKQMRYLIRIGEGEAQDRTVSSKMFGADEEVVNPKGFYWSTSKTGGGSTVNVNTGADLKPTDVLQFKKNYQDVTKAPREQADVLADLDSLLEMPASGARDKAAISKLTQAFDGGVRALTNLQQWRSLGDLGTRIAGGLSNFFLGTMGDTQEAEFKELIKQYQKDFNSRYNKVKAKEWDFAASQPGLNPRDVVGEDRYQQYQYGGKTYELDMFTGQTVREIK